MLALQCQVVSHLLFTQLPESRFEAASAFYLACLKFRLCRNCYNAYLDRLLRHLPFKTFFQRQQGSMDGIL